MIKLDDEFKDWYFDNMPLWYLDYIYSIYQLHKSFRHINNLNPVTEQKVAEDFNKLYKTKARKYNLAEILKKLPKEE